MATSWRAFARDLVRLREGRFDWWDAVRAGACAGGVVLVGWSVGAVPAGLTASIGAFTALYGNGRPYRYRAIELATIALAFALVVTIGALAESSVWVSIVVVAVIAVVATALCQAFDTGPPGAYMFVLAGATSTAIPGAAAEPWRLGLLVLAGGALAWVAHMVGALAGLRSPEKATVAAGAAAVSALLDAVGTDRYPEARDRAARAMHACWVVLVGQQPLRARTPGTLERLRALALDLHGLLAEGIRAHDEGRPVDPHAAERLRTLAGTVAHPPAVPRPVGTADVPLGGPGIRRVLRDMLAPGSPWRSVLARVGIAALVAGAVGSLAGLDHAYWAVAAAVLVLCQGLGWTGTLERAALRLAGTWIGLLLAAAVLSAQPSGVALALTIAVLQAAIQLAMPRNYGLGVVVVTPIALTIGSAGHPSDLGALLLARGLDTAVGVAIGVLVFLLVVPGAARPGPATLIAATLRDVARVVPHLADATTTSPAAREARRDLNQRILALADAHHDSDAAPVGHTVDTTVWWPALDATRGVAHRALAACWAVDATRTPEHPATPWITGERADAILEALTDLDDPGDGFLAPELDALRRALPQVAT
ncbi:putative membrane protein YccC [Actinomycetospora succinea]|uniref:Putative membrane protein YccC n=1 Tax=Actinomycetospora succinea TaxID=663603 RepID=A0A4R6VLZ0_9PSEU|nr:FUSC family protein [Actinomycetospora succinea]TDQ64759.1 putative membrane protein YccC [Actinomycetospora succinea]